MLLLYPRTVIEEIAQTGASFFPSNFEDGVPTGETGIPAIPPTKLHALGVRDASYHGHSFDSFCATRHSDPHA